MKVKLISYSQIPIDSDNTECKNILDLVCYAARVSNPLNQMNTSTNEKLSNYLMNNNHWSPFEMTSICLEIETTRDISRQLLRHRSFSFQEFSQRYAIADLGFEEREARMQDKKNRQNSILSDNDKLNSEWIEKQNEVKNCTLSVYNWAIENGIAKEQARVVLTEGNTISRLYVNGTLRSWIHYIQLRSGNGTQSEHKELARECAKQIEPIFPFIVNFVSD